MSSFISNISKAFFFNIILLLLVIFLIFAGSGINDNGYRTVVQYPWGTTYVKFSPGIYLTFFGKETVYKDSGTYTFGISDRASNVVSTIHSSPVEVRYNDGGLGEIHGVYRWILPTDEKTMLELHRTYRSQDGVAGNLVKPTINEALNLTAALMSSEASYAEKRETFKRWSREQAEIGAFATSETTVCEDNPAGERECRTVAQINYKDGKVIYGNRSPLQEYGLKTGQYQITKWDYEKRTLQQISDKREQTMKIITAKAEAEAAKQEAVTAEEKGKAAVTKARYEKEVEKVRAVVDAEKQKEIAVIEAVKKVEVNEQNKLAAEQDKLAAAEEKQASILRGEGDAKARRLKMEADNALEQKLQAWKDVNYRYAQAIEKQKWVPEIQFANGANENSGSTASALIDMFAAKTAKEISLDLSMTPPKTQSR